MLAQFCTWQNEFSTFLSNSNISTPPLSHSVFQEGVGKILNDLTGHRRASIRSIDTSSSGKDMLQRSMIYADVPLAKLVGYATNLRSISSGEASLSMVLHGYRVSHEQHQPSP